MNPAIVVVAYNRDHSLKRLLDCISRAYFDSRVDLIISIDKSENKNIFALANSFRWVHGKKEILAKKDHLGLRNHILECGDLTDHYDSIILLEDDLFVSPYFYKFSKQVLEFYQEDEDIAGISLYSHRYNETAKMAFWPIDDNSDVFFLQIASSWGQCWTKDQWKGFRDWYEKNGDKDIAMADNLPINVAEWPRSSWKKYFIKYMVDNDKYFVFPRMSLSTNFHDPGTHHAAKQTLLQVPLQLLNKEWIFKRLVDSIAVYDAYLEILPDKLKKMAKHIEMYDFDVDFYAQKNLKSVSKEYLLTSRESDESIETYGKELKPVELNVVFEIEGTGICLARRNNCKDDRRRNEAADRAYYYGIPEEFLYDGKLQVKGKFYNEHYYELCNEITQVFYSSRSWKITAPLRWVARHVRKLKGMVSGKR